MSRNTQSEEPITAADFTAILSTTLAMAAEAGLRVGVRNRAADDNRPAGLLIFVSGIQVGEGGELVAPAPAVGVAD
jgi:hypothetical protein